MANGLASELNKPVDPFDIVSQVSSGTLEQRGAAARRERPKLMREQAQAAEEFALGTQEAKLEQAQEESKIQEDFAKSERQLIEDARRSMPIRPEINITQYDEGSAAKTAMLTAVVGAIFGAASGRGALRAMQGVVQGAREGREDLYKAEVDRFDRELSKWKDEVLKAKEILKESRELLNTDKGAALAKLKELDPTLNRGLVKMGIRTQNLNKVDEYLNQAQKGIDTIELEFAKAAAKPPKISDKQRTAINQNQELLRRLQNLRNTAKKDYFALASVPLIADQLADLRIDMQEIGLGDLASIFGLDVTDQAVLWWKDYYDLIADIRKERFGATLTGNELKSFRQTSVKPSSTFEIGTGVLDRQIELARQSHQNVMQSIGREQPTAGAAQTDVNTIRQQAQAAIAAGKDEAQVRAKFRELTGQEL